MCGTTNGSGCNEPIARDNVRRPEHKPSFIPFDGDPATDENKAEVIDWKNVPVNTAATGQPSNINQKKLTTFRTTIAIRSLRIRSFKPVVWCGVPNVLSC